jgi:isopentenyl phosphate kinase
MDYLVKMGGSVITDIRKQNTAKPAEILRIFKEIKPGLKDKRMVVGHGSGSFAHIPAHKYKVNSGLCGDRSMKGASITQDAAANLHRIVFNGAIAAGIRPLSFPPSSGALSENGTIKSWDLSAMMHALDRGFVPITYGDVVIDSAKGISIASTEEVFRHIAKATRPRKIVIGTDVDGIFDSDPKTNEDARLIKEVNRSNIAEILDYAGGSTKVDVTGGMKTKIRYLYDMSKDTGAVCQIINLMVPGNLKKTIEGRKVVGTTIDANRGK